MPKENLILRLKLKTQKTGSHNLWGGYHQPNTTRTPSQVSTTLLHGRFYAKLISELRPKVIVEFGTAFGVSGMYWLTALEVNERGHLYTYEINNEWAAIADANLKRIGNRYTLTNGLFEENIDNTLGNKRIDVAFIDGVHTSEWVIPQYELVVQHASRRAVIILDDISFSKDMEECWGKLSQEKRVKNALRLDSRVGILQL